MNEQAEAAARAMSAPGVSLLEAIGNTPLLDLSRIAAGVPGLRLLAKAEHMNPGGSVKDRPARAMLLDGLRRGLLAPGKTILEATSGNTGIADAMIGRALGFPVTLCVPARGSSAQKTAILEAFGAEVVPTDPLEGSDGAIRKARAIAAAEPERYFYPDQYSNPENWRAHFTTTGPEIWEETRGELTHFVAGLGTTGTFGGVTRYLKSKCRRLAREEGILVGPSAAANVVAAVRVAREMTDRPATIVTILCDGGGRYLSQPFWEEP